ncbi:RING finger protein [Gracilaria domingensis]|nr:RING finger protein [Gracilaria domingensis]
MRRTASESAITSSSNQRAKTRQARQTLCKSAATQRAGGLLLEPRRDTRRVKLIAARQDANRLRVGVHIAADGAVHSTPFVALTVVLITRVRRQDGYLLVGEPLLGVPNSVLNLQQHLVAGRRARGDAPLGAHGGVQTAVSEVGEAGNRLVLRGGGERAPRRKARSGADGNHARHQSEDGGGEEQEHGHNDDDKQVRRAGGLRGGGGVVRRSESGGQQRRLQRIVGTRRHGDTGGRCGPKVAPNGAPRHATHGAAFITQTSRSAARHAPPRRARHAQRVAHVHTRTRAHTCAFQLTFCAHVGLDPLRRWLSKPLRCSSPNLAPACSAFESSLLSAPVAAAALALSPRC